MIISIYVFIPFIIFSYFYCEFFPWLLLLRGVFLASKNRIFFGYLLLLISSVLFVSRKQTVISVLCWDLLYPICDQFCKNSMCIWKKCTFCNYCLQRLIYIYIYVKFVKCFCKSFTYLVNFFSLFLSVIVRGMLKSFMIVDLPIFSFGFVNFCFICFVTMLSTWNVVYFLIRQIFLLLWNDLFL